MKLKFSCVNLALALLLVVTFTAVGATSAKAAATDGAAEAMGLAMKKLGVTPDQAGFMVLTNAGYGQADGKTTEAYLDLLAKTTGRTPGTKTLLAVDTPCTEPLWFSFFNRDTKDVVFVKKGAAGFDSQSFNLAPETIFQPDAWAAAVKGLVGKRMFSVTSISLSWAEGAAWTMLKAAELHDHFCPGLNAGFIIKAKLDKDLPLGKGDRYVFVGAPPICAMDVLQSVYGCTMGKKGAFSMMVPKAAKQAAKGGVPPFLIAMRVNAKKDVCDGMVLALDWDKLGSATGVNKKDLSPKGGSSNPLFYIVRTKMSWKLVQMDMKDKLVSIVEQARFSGPAGLMKKVIGAGADPYAVLPK